MNALIYNLIALFSFDCFKLKARFADMDKKIRGAENRQQWKNVLLSATILSDFGRIVLVSAIAAYFYYT